MSLAVSIRTFLPVLILLQTQTPLLHCQERVQLVSGDVTLAAMFGVNALEGDGCGAYDVNVLKRMMAVTWFLDILNDMDYFGGGVRLGLTIYRTCQNQGRAMTHAVDMLNQFHVLTPQSAQTANFSTPLLGLLGPDRTEEVSVVSRFLSSLPPSLRPLEISASATGESLVDRALYSNLFRVIPPDNIQVDALLELLKALHWNYIAVIYDDHDYGLLASQRLRRLASTSNICVTYHSKIPLDSRRLAFSEAVSIITDVLREKLIKGVVFIGNRATAKELLIMLHKRVLFPRFIFSEAVGLQDSVFQHMGQVLHLSKGAFVVTPPSRPLPTFKEHWNAVWSNRTLFLTASERNPWLGGYFHQLSSGCTAQDVQCWSGSQSRRPLLGDNARWLFEYYNIKAVAVFAALLKKLLNAYCQDPLQGLCPKLRDVLVNDRQKVQRLLQTSSFDLESSFLGVTSAFRNFTSVRFDGDGEIVERADGIGESVYDVYNFRRCQEGEFCFKKVGGLTWENDLMLNTSAVRGYDESGKEVTSPNIPKAQCSENAICTECLPFDIANDIIMIPGDFYFVAVASVYGRDRTDMQGCGPIQTSSGADLIQGILFSLQQVNADVTGIFSGSTKLGVIVLNSCFRELVIKRKLMDLHSGKLQLPDGRNSSAILPYIAGYVGAYYSTISVAMYEVLSKVTSRFVVLSPTNTSPNLSDREKYPLYMRMTTKSDDQTKVMLDIVRRLNSSYIQVIYDPEDDYSWGLKEAINDLSHRPPFNICVVQNVNTSYDDNSLGKVRERLLQYSWASVVLVPLQYEHARNFTNIVTTAIKPGQFVFIGSEAWEVRQELIDPVDGKEKRMEGSFAIYQGLPLDRQFDSYFKNLAPFSSINPWLRYFWEAAEDCYFQDSFEKKGRRPCPAGQGLTQGYQQSVWVPFYINAVKVFAEGLRSAMMDRCQGLTLCEKLRSADLLRHLKGVRMDMTGTRQEQPVFDQNGDGGLGFEVYQVQRRLGKLVYAKVGTYLNGVGSLTISPASVVSGQCLLQEQCQHCFPATPRATCRLGDDSDEPVRTAFIVVLVLLIVVIVAGGIVVGVYLLRHRKAQTSQGAPELAQRQQSIGMTPVPETGGARIRRLHSTPSSVFASGTGSEKSEQPYEDIPDVIHCPACHYHHHHHHHPHHDCNQHHPHQHRQENVPACRAMSPRDGSPGRSSSRRHDEYVPPQPGQAQAQAQAQAQVHAQAQAQAQAQDVQDDPEDVSSGTSGGGAVACGGVLPGLRFVNEGFTDSSSSDF